MGCGLCWVYERAAGKFFFSAFYFRGIRDDIEEEDEQVSELPPLFSAPLATTDPPPPHPALVTSPGLQPSVDTIHDGNTDTLCYCCKLPEEKIPPAAARCSTD